MIFVRKDSITIGISEHDLDSYLRSGFSRLGEPEAEQEPVKLENSEPEAKSEPSKADSSELEATPTVKVVRRSKK